MDGEVQSATATNEAATKFRCYKQDGYWYMETGGGGRFGPFDSMVHTHMKEYKTVEQEVCEPQLSSLLAQYA